MSPAHLHSVELPRDVVVVTGAAGTVAALIMPTLRRAFRLRRLDLAPQKPEHDDEIVHTDVRDVAAVSAACVGAAAVVHLAAEPDEADFRSRLLPRNLDGSWAVFEGAVAAGVPRLVFASTIQVIDGYPVELFVELDRPPRPVSVYGCTKVFGEALGRFYADARGLGVACVRIGGVVKPDDARLANDSRFRTLWCAPDDLARLVIAAVRSDVQFATVVAVSPPATSRFDTSNPFGWAPQCEPAAIAGRANRLATED